MKGAKLILVSEGVIKCTFSAPFPKGMRKFFFLFLIKENDSERSRATSIKRTIRSPFTKKKNQRQREDKEVSELLHLVTPRHKSLQHLHPLTYFLSPNLKSIHMKKKS